MATQYHLFAPAAVARARQASLRKVKPGCVIVTETSFESAVVHATSARTAGMDASVSCRLSDLLPPSRHISRSEWQGACILYLHSIEMRPLLLPEGTKLREQVHLERLLTSIGKASEILTARIREQRTKANIQVRGYVCGRPPYGYAIKDGAFVIDERQSEAVRFIFEGIRDRRPQVEILRQLKRQYRSDFWDRAKIRRILGHARMYCLGEYATASHTVPVTIPGISFLPGTWITTTIAAKGAP